MIPVKYPRILCIMFLMGVFSNIWSEDPFSVFAGFQHRLSRISTLKAAIERRQTYRDFRRNATGVFEFDRSTGTRYEWKTPGHYLFISTDSIVCGIDMNKHCGWKATPESLLRRQTDPLGQLLRLQFVPPEEFSYRGNNDSLLFFSLAMERKTFCNIGIDPKTERCRIIEFFEAKGILLEKTIFSFTKKQKATVLPDVVIISKIYGNDLVTDTISIRRLRLNTTVEKKKFTFPEGIIWGKNRTAGCSPQLEFHPAAGR
jgi:hypothetical protein